MPLLHISFSTLRIFYTPHSPHSAIRIIFHRTRLYILGNYSLMLLAFNFTKRPEVDVAKTTTSGKSHGMLTVCNRRDTDRRCAKINLASTRTLSAFLCCDCLGISSWMCGADCWQVSESEAETILASDSSSKSESTLRGFRGW